MSLVFYKSSNNTLERREKSALENSGGGGFKSIRPKRLAACSFCCSSLDSQEQTLSMPFKYVFIWKIGFEGKSAELFCLIGLPNF